MGSLKPGTTYIYERDGKITYAREFGADPSTRLAIGWDYNKDDPTFDPRTKDGRPLIDQMREDQLWGNIRREAKTNITLQKALDRAIMIYKLSKERYE
jgi:hypothetical protein